MAKIKTRREQPDSRFSLAITAVDGRFSEYKTLVFARPENLIRIRKKLATWYLRRRLINRPVTIIADDCWGGRLYSNLGVPCRSPFIGCGIRTPEYLDLLTHLREPDALAVQATSRHPEYGYPLLHTRYACLFGLHYSREDEFRHQFERRVKIIAWDNIRIKIDLGKPACGPDEISRWNALRPSASVALCPAAMPRRPYQGLVMQDWHWDALDQFDHSSRYFDVVSWLNYGTLGTSPGYRLAQFLLLDKKCLYRGSLLAPAGAQYSGFALAQAVV